MVNYVSGTNSTSLQQLLVTDLDFQSIKEATVSGATGGLAIPISDSKKLRLIQQHLVLLLHTQKCLRREQEQSSSPAYPCQLPLCATVKDVLKHMTECPDGKACKGVYAKQLYCCNTIVIMFSGESLIVVSTVLYKYFEITALKE